MVPRANGSAEKLFDEIAVLDHHAGKDHRHDRDQLDQDVESRPRGVLERVTNGVTDHTGFVGLRALAAEMTFLDVLLGVILSTASVGHVNGDSEATGQAAHELAQHPRNTQQEANQNGHHDGQDGWHHHFFLGTRRRDINT